MQPFRVLSEAEIRAIYQQGEDAVVTRIQVLVQNILLLSERVQALEDQLAKNSRNSGKPPSTDGPFDKPAPKSQRKRHGRKTGGQPGHEGHTLKAVAHPDHVEIHRVYVCCQCQTSLENVAVIGYEKRQLFDLPQVHLKPTKGIPKSGGGSGKASQETCWSGSKHTSRQHWLLCTILRCHLTTIRLNAISV